jgi:uncharacterized protein DUF6049
MRRLAPLTVLVVALVGVLFGSAAARAQGEASSSVRLTLISQSVWNGPTHPLKLTVRAANTLETPLTSLSVVLAIEAPARSRSAYELSLGSGAAVISAASFPQAGAIEPGGSRDFTIRQPLDALTALAAQSALYPLRVDVLSQDAVVGTLRTPLIFLIEKPEFPLNLTWSWALAEPAEFGPDGVLAAGNRIERDIAPGGLLDTEVGTLAGGRAVPVDVAISPLLVRELDRMASGYRVLGDDGKVRSVKKGTEGSADAARVLSRVRLVAARPGTELIALPYPDPSLPALSQAGLLGRLDDLLRRGRAEVEAALGRAPAVDVARPPGSKLDAASMSRLVALGARIVLLDPGVLPTPEGLQFSPPSVVRVSAAGSSVDAIVPDPGVPRLSAAFRSDPRLAAQVALGELASKWLELPGTSGRGAAVAFSDTTRPHPMFLAAFTTLVRASPWLKPVSASRMSRLAPPTGRQPLPSKAFPGFAPDYVSRLHAVEDSLARYATAIHGAGATAVLARLSDDLLLALSGTALSKRAVGDRLLRTVEDSIQATYRGVRTPPAGSLITLTSRGGTIPITLRNDSRFRLRLRVRLLSDRRLSFTGGDSQLITLAADHRVARIQFPVKAQTTGKFPLKVQVQTVGDFPEPAIVAETQMIVRSTAYNRVALVLTIGAGLFLLGWWGRRFLPRRTS